MNSNYLSNQDELSTDSG